MTEERIVDLIASGYEWICPDCDTLNHEIEITNEVFCTNCDKRFIPADDVHHAYH